MSFESPTLEDLHAWLARLRGPSITSDDVACAAAELRTIGPEKLFPRIRQLLAADDPEMRCLASLGAFVIDQTAAVDLLLPLLKDPDITVRWHTCGLMHDIADTRTTEVLIRVMREDSDPQVRNTAAYALGGVADPRAIPALIETLENDHEVDELGHTASHHAATALDDILKTSETRFKDDQGLCTLTGSTPDLALLKSQALAFYERWCKTNQL